MADEAHFERYEDTEGGWRYRLRAANGEIVLPPESVSRKEDVERQISDMVGVMATVVSPLHAGAEGEEPVYKVVIEDAPPEPPPEIP